MGVTTEFTDPKEMYDYLLAAPDGQVLEAWNKDKLYAVLSKKDWTYQWSTRKFVIKELSLEFGPANWLRAYPYLSFRPTGSVVALDEEEIWE